MVFGAGLTATITPPPEFESQSLISLNDAWKFNALNNDLGTSWRVLGYDDSSWTNGPALIYATGGLAYGHVTTDVAFSDFNFGTPASGSAHIEALKVGWTAGFGGEMQIAGNWTGKLEYLYVDLGNVSSGGFNAQFTPVQSEATRFDGAFRDHIVRFGVNYKFGEPVFASAAGDAYAMFTKAPPLRAYDWSG